MKLKLLAMILVASQIMQALKAQPDTSTADTTAIFSFETFYDLILRQHPVVRQAQLLSQQAAQELRLAKGAFDPKIDASWQTKKYQNTVYYDLLDASLKVPLWFPIDPKIGIERHEGEYLNPEHYISDKTDYKQLYMGVSIPVGQGLFIDQRRATLKQARLLQDMAEADQVKMINKILLSATKDYWEWYYAYNNYALLQQSIEIAQDIFDRTRLGFEYGEVAAIDTVQALILLQKRITDFQQATIERSRAALTLSNHLWNEQGMPLALQDAARPDTLLIDLVSQEALGHLLEQARANHPELLKLELKNQSLAIDQRLAKENLKPSLQLDYALLNQPLAANGEQNDIQLTDNYKIEMNFSIPLFLRKERAKVAQTELKIQDNALERVFTERSIINDINAQYVTLNTTEAIIEQQQEMVNNYQLVVEAERFNLENGESDLFKINAQLDKLIEEQSKLFKLKATYQKDLASLYWAAGIPYLGLHTFSAE